MPWYGLIVLPHLQAELPGHVAAHDDVARVGLEKPAAGLHFKSLARSIPELREELGGGADEPIPFVVVANGVRNRQLHARVRGNLLVHRPGNVSRRRLEVEHRVEDELQLTASGAKHGVEAHLPAGERVVGLVVDREDRHGQAGRQTHGHDGDGGRQRVLAQASPNQRHQTESHQLNLPPATPRARPRPGSTRQDLRHG